MTRPLFNEITSTHSSFEDVLLENQFSLTLEEIAHIRSVLTKAELESLPTDGQVKEDVEKRKVCFLCLKTRFGLLGPWGQNCRLCKKTVCVKCYSKMQIPDEQFSNIPIMLLYPIISNSASPVHYNFEMSQNWSNNICNTGLASAKSKREIPKHFQSLLKFPDIITYGSIGTLKRIRQRNTENTLLMIVCHDCRLMVVEIIKNSRITRDTIKNNIISRLTLDISPMYV